MTPSQDQTPGESAPPTERTPAGVGGHSTVHPDDYLLGNWQPDGAPAPEPAPHATPAAPPAAAAPAPYATSSPPPASSSAPPVPLPTQPTGAADTARGPLPRPLIAAAVVAFVLAAWFAVEGIYVATNEELLATLMQNLAAQMPDQQPIEPSQLSFMLLMLYGTMTTLYAVAARRLLALSLGARFLLVILGWVNMALFIRFAMIDGHPFITWIDNLAAGVALIGLLSAPSVVRRFYSERVASMREMATAAATAAHQARQRHAAHMAHGASMQAQAQASSSATPGSQPAPPDPRHIAPYPLQLVPHLDVRPWGDGSHLRALGKQAPAGQSIGESWEVSGHPYAPSIVRNGPLAGRTLNEVMTAWGEWLLGPGRNPVPVRVGDTWEWRFPLLAKFLDTQSWLSVQVHPPDRDGLPGKTEAWVVLSAEPGACIYQGFSRNVTADEVREAVAANQLAGLLQSVPVQAGDVIYNPAGVVHAIGRGICLFEIQQVCDTTYRLHDFGRTGRPLHVEQAIEVMRLEAGVPERPAPASLPPARLGLTGPDAQPLVSSPYFRLWRVRLPADGSLGARSGGDTVALVHHVGGPPADLVWSNSTHDRLVVGDCRVVPASVMTHGMRLQVAPRGDEGSNAGEATLLIVTP